MEYYSNISFPTPQNIPPPNGEILDYESPTPLLPLETELIEEMRNSDRCVFRETDISNLSVLRRDHTVVGHYTHFSSQHDWDEKDGVSFTLQGSRVYLDSILYLKNKQPLFLEIYSCGDDVFPADGIIQSVGKFRPSIEYLGWAE